MSCWRFVRRVLIVGAVTTFLALAGLAAPASAHAVLEFTQPADGAVLSSSPARVVMGFDESVELPLGSVAVYNSAARRVDQGLAYHPGGRADQIAANLPGHLPAGGYVVTWRVISADSHPVHGAFTFQVGSAGSAIAIQNEAAGLLNAQRGSHTVGVVFGIDRAVSYAAVTLLLGGALLLALAWPEGMEELAARRLLWGSYALAVLTTIAALLLQGPYGAGQPLRVLVKSAVVSSVLDTRYGKLYLARALLLLLAIGPLLWIQFRRRPPGKPPLWWGPAALGAAVAVLIIPGLADHASSGRLVPLSVTFDLVHLGAVSVWVGGLGLLAAVGLSARYGRRLAREVLPRFSQWALAAVVAIIVSGGFAAWREVGSIHNVTTTTYGRLVLAKTILLVAIVLLATVSRTLTHGNLAVPFVATRLPRGAGVIRTPANVSAGPGAAILAAKPIRAHGRGGRRRLRQSVTIELAFAAAALSVAAVLVNVQPGRQAADQPFTTEVRAGPRVLVDLVLDHTRAGANTLHLYTLSPDGERLSVPQIAATANHGGNGIIGLPVALQLSGPGHFISSGLNLPIPGAWTFNLTVRTDAIDEYYASPVTVHLH
jgi:copper transport protein